MIKIAHTGDVHLGDLPGPTKDGLNVRRLDTLGCMEAIVNRVEVEKPNLTIIAGDLFNRSRVWADTALDDVNDALERFIRPLCRYSDSVVLLFGTCNHDNPRAFEVIRKATTDLANLSIYTEPKVEKIFTTAGPLQVMAVPGFDKARLRLFLPGMDTEAENQGATALVNNIILGLAEQLEKDCPAVLTAHYTVSGSESENGSTFLAGQDVVILPATIDAAGVDLACFGHIHKPQKLPCNTPAYYCGSPNQLTFNDENMEHGFWVHTIFDTPEAGKGSQFFRCPERQHMTVKMNADDVAAFISTGLVTLPEAVKDKIIRVRYTCSTEQEKAFNRAELQRQIMTAGAFYVAEITPEDIEELDGKDNLTEHDGPAECLARWLETNDITGEKAARLTELAAPIIREADDGRDDGKHTGAFIPRTIEVKNYRSYTEASFDFEPVRMAMVNGHNGVGKSSLFMDAIADCLYEQTRKEDIGGWVRDGTKSGAITFTFGMGGQEYRVIRTRTKSGRGTLALQRINQETGAWEDESDTTMKLTQAKIERLLGMDCNTFCSIALIRQDAYGLFLDADSDRRMEVLSALLGLDIYNRMYDITRARSTEQRRKIAANKERINLLAEQSAVKDELLAEDANIASRIEQIEGTIRECEAELKAAESAEALCSELRKQATDTWARSDELWADAQRKGAEREGLIREMADAEKKALGLEEARAAGERVKVLRARLDEIDPQLQRNKELLKEKTDTYNAVVSARDRLQSLEYERRQNEGILARRGEIEAAQAALAELDPRMDEAQHRMAECQRTMKAKEAAKAAVDQHVADSRVRIGELESRLKSARAEAGKLADSGCPNPESATCKFLTSAVAAQAAIPDLSVSLETMKADDRAKYEVLKAAYEKAAAEDAALGDPAADIMDIDAEQKKHRDVAALAPALAACEATIKKIDAAIAEAKEIIEKGEARDREIAAERSTLAAAVLEYSDIQVELATVEKKADTLAACEAAAATVKAIGPRVDGLEREIIDLQNKAMAAREESNAIKARIPSNVGNADGMRSVLASNRRTANDLASQRGRVKAKLEAIAEAEDQSAELRYAVEKIAATLDDYTTLEQAFSIDGIQYMIIRGVVPEIMRQSNDILASMTGGRMAVDIRTERENKSNKKIVNSLEVWINSITGGTRPYQSHSGGEKVKIALAVTLGLADVKARRAGVQLGMLFIDEPPFLDGDGTEAYADALVSMGGRNPSMRILAISHDPTMKARFQQNITVSDGENGSVVEME